MVDLEIKIEPIEFAKTKDYDKLKDVCVEYMEFLASENYHEDNDWDHWIYEAAMKFIYGVDVFKEVNRLTREYSKRYMEERHKRERENLERQQSKEFGGD